MLRRSKLSVTEVVAPKEEDYQDLLILLCQMMSLGILYPFNSHGNCNGSLNREHPTPFLL